MMKLYKIEAGIYQCDGGAVFGVVPKKVWRKRYPSNEENTCPFSMRCLFIDTGERRILIETGCGDKQLDYLKYYDFFEPISFEKELNKIGYKASDVTDVLLTHLHFDHCGGCTYYEDEDHTKLSLSFPNATYWVGKPQWENYLHPNVREGNSYFPENMMPIAEAGKLKTIDENCWFTPEIELRFFNGHTIGQLVCYIHSGKNTLVYVGDVIPIAASIPLAWVSAYDTDPICSMEEKKRLLDEAIDKKQILFFEHDATTEACTVKSVNGKYSMDALIKREELGFSN